jgi:hypothetical protein
MGPWVPPLGSLRPASFMLIAFPTVFLSYTRILLFPFDLHTDRMLPHLGPYAPLAGLFVVTLAIALFYKGPRWARLCWLWYVLTLLPKTYVMMAGSFMSDHWAYPALPALIIPIAAALDRAIAVPASRKTAGVALVLLLSLEMAVAHLSISHRNSDIKLYRQALEHTHSVTMQNNLRAVESHAPGASDSSTVK